MLKYLTKIDNEVRKYEASRNKSLILIIFSDTTQRLMDHNVTDFIASQSMHYNGNPSLHDLYLYGHGGDVVETGRAISIIKRIFGEYEIVIPYKAKSALSLFAIAAKNILVTRVSELGPLDPQLSVNLSNNSVTSIAAEDVKSFPENSRRWFNHKLSDAELFNILLQKMYPPSLSSIYRAHEYVKSLIISNCFDRLGTSKAEEIAHYFVNGHLDHRAQILARNLRDLGLNCTDLSYDLGIAVTTILAESQIMMSSVEVNGNLPSVLIRINGTYWINYNKSKPIHEEGGRTMLRNISVWEKISIETEGKE